MYKTALIVSLLSLLFAGCATKNYTASTTPQNIEKHNEVMKKAVDYTLKATKDFYEQEVRIKPNSKVFVLNAHPDEAARSKAMFNYAIKLMNEEGLCYKNKRDGSVKCAKPKIVLTKDGERADLIMETLEGKMDKYEAYTAILQFNYKYFPGFEILDPEALLKVYEKLGITNELLEDKFYSYCVLSGALEETLEKSKSVLVDDPDKADYILLYQTLGCSEKYQGHQPENLLTSLKTTAKTGKIETADNKNLDPWKQNGSIGLLNGYNYGAATSTAFKTYFTPTVIGFSALGMLAGNYSTTQGAAYEYILIDKKAKSYYGNVAEMTRRKDHYRNGMYSLVQRAADYMAE